MGNTGIQQHISAERLSTLLRSVYEGRILLPEDTPPGWGDKDRLELFENIYRGLPIGTLTLWRTTQQREPLQSIGSVPLRLPERMPGSVRTYLDEGIGQVVTLFEELGPALWRSDPSSQKRPLLRERPQRFVVFDLESRNFDVCQEDRSLRQSEFPVCDLLDPERQSVSKARLESLPEGGRLANRLARMVDTFFDFSLPVITLISSDAGPFGERRPVDQIPTTKSLRKLMREVLLDDASFDAFCLDNFPEIFRRFSAGMERHQKENLLLVSVRPAEVLKKLRDDFPDQVAEHEALIEYNPWGASK